MYRLLGSFPADVCCVPYDGRVYALRRRRCHPLCVFLHFDYPYPAFHRGYPLCAYHVRPWPIWRLLTASEVGQVHLSPLALRGGLWRGGVLNDFSVLRLKSLPLFVWSV